MAKVQWLDRRFYVYGPHVALVTDAAGLRRALRSLKIDPATVPWTTSVGRTWYFEREGDGTTCIVGVDRARLLADNATPCEINGLIVHEAVHVWQRWCHDLEDHEPGMEQEAYAIQYIAGRLMAAYWGES